MPLEFLVADKHEPAHLQRWLAFVTWCIAGAGRRHQVVGGGGDPYEHFLSA